MFKGGEEARPKGCRPPFLQEVHQEAGFHCGDDHDGEDDHDNDDEDDDDHDEDDEELEDFHFFFNETFTDPSWPPHLFTDLVCFGSRHLVIIVIFIIIIITIIIIIKIIIIIIITIDIVTMIIMTMTIRYAVYQLELLPAGVHASFHTLATTFLIRLVTVMMTMMKKLICVVGISLSYEMVRKQTQNLFVFLSSQNSD